MSSSTSGDFSDYMKARAKAENIYRAAVDPAWKTYKDALEQVEKSHQQALDQAEKTHLGGEIPNWEAVDKAKDEAFANWRMDLAKAWQTYLKVLRQAEEIYDDTINRLEKYSP